jgi:hypothetical protein
MHMPRRISPLVARRPLQLALLCAPFLAGCNPALWGNALVLAVSFGIFWGTLTLGRAQEAARSRGGASQSVPTRRT